jgi:hypothetical protein
MVVVQDAPLQAHYWPAALCPADGTYALWLPLDAAMTSTAFLTITYVTALLKSLIEHGLVRDKIADLVGGVTVSALPPEQTVSASEEHAHLNVFLSHITPNTRVRSFGRRAGVDASENRMPLPLDLHYIITAHSAKEFRIETLLGFVGVLFRDCPVLLFERGSWGAANESATSAEQIDSPVIPGATAQLPLLIESIEIRPTFPSADEMSKVWSSLQVKGRPSLSYKVEVRPENGERRSDGPGFALQRAR